MNNKQRQALKKVQVDIDRLWNRIETIKEAEDVKNDNLAGTLLESTRMPQQIRGASDQLADISDLLSKASEMIDLLVEDVKH